MEQFPFRRDFYNLMVENIEDNSVTFLTGTRKSGKTVCLRQLENDLPNTVYVDFKYLKQFGLGEQYNVLSDIKKAIKNNEKRIFLLDEITHVRQAESFIYDVATEIFGHNNSNTKVVFTGSQTVALDSWATRAFAGNAGYVHVDFLTYSEFLRYKNISEVSPDTYSQFLYEASDFYKFNSLEKYLKGCLEETIISNANTTNYIYNNEVNYINGKEKLLIDICYQTLFTLHNRVNAQTFFSDNKLQTSLISSFKNECNLSDDDIVNKIDNSFVKVYNSLDSQRLEVLKEAFVFLKQCGLITITPIVKDLKNVPDIWHEFCSDDSKINVKDDLFRRYNVTIDYPMFYVQILKDILKKDMPDKLPGRVLGSIVECHLRGLLPDGVELHNKDMKDVEIDYINEREGLAVEFSISSKHKNNFHILDDSYKCIMLTKDKNVKQGKVEKIDYCKFIYDLSQMRYASTRSKKTNSSSFDKQSDVNLIDNISNKLLTYSDKYKKAKDSIKSIIVTEKEKLLSSFDFVAEFQRSFFTSQSQNYR